MEWTLFDYGVGNIHSLRKALEAQGQKVKVTPAAQDLYHAEAIVLPGVGAFGAVMRSLEPGRQAIIEHHAAGKPMLGICIGMQVLYDGSDEDPETPGLGIVPGRAIAIPPSAGKVPHLGWNTATPCGRHGGDAPASGDGPATDQGPAGGPTDHLADAIGARHVYYVHSYAAPPGEHDIARSHYGVEFAAALRSRNTIAFQFHPEKSSQAGQDILAAALAALEAAE